MNKKFSDERISAFLDGELAPHEQAEMERQLADGAELRQAVEELRALGSGLQSLPRYRLEGDFADRVLQLAEREVLTSRADRVPPANEASGASSASDSSPRTVVTIPLPQAASSAPASTPTDTSGGQLHSPFQWRTLFWAAAAASIAVVLTNYYHAMNEPTPSNSVVVNDRSGAVSKANAPGSGEERKPGSAEIKRESGSSAALKQNDTGHDRILTASDAAVHDDLSHAAAKSLDGSANRYAGEHGEADRKSLAERKDSGAQGAAGADSALADTRSAPLGGAGRGSKQFDKADAARDRRSRQELNRDDRAKMIANADDAGRAETHSGGAASLPDGAKGSAEFRGGRRPGVGFGGGANGQAEGKTAPGESLAGDESFGDLKASAGQFFGGSPGAAAAPTDATGSSLVVLDVAAEAVDRGALTKLMSQYQVAYTPQPESRRNRVVEEHVTVPRALPGDGGGGGDVVVKQLRTVANDDVLSVEMTPAQLDALLASLKSHKSDFPLIARYDAPDANAAEASELANDQPAEGASEAESTRSEAAKSDAVAGKTGDGRRDEAHGGEGHEFAAQAKESVGDATGAEKSAEGKAKGERAEGTEAAKSPTRRKGMSRGGIGGGQAGLPEGDLSDGTPTDVGPSDGRPTPGDLKVDGQKGDGKPSERKKDDAPLSAADERSARGDQSPPGFAKSSGETAKVAPSKEAPSKDAAMPANEKPRPAPAVADKPAYLDKPAASEKAVGAKPSPAKGERAGESNLVPPAPGPAAKAGEKSPDKNAAPKNQPNDGGVERMAPRALDEPRDAKLPAENPSGEPSVAPVPTPAPREAAPKPGAARGDERRDAVEAPLAAATEPSSNSNAVRRWRPRDFDEHRPMPSTELKTDPAAKADSTVKPAEESMALRAAQDKSFAGKRDMKATADKDIAKDDKPKRAETYKAEGVEAAPRTSPSTESKGAARDVIPGARSSAPAPRSLAPTAPEASSPAPSASDAKPLAEKAPPPEAVRGVSPPAAKGASGGDRSSGDSGEAPRVADVAQERIRVTFVIRIAPPIAVPATAAEAVPAPASPKP